MFLTSILQTFYQSFAVFLTRLSFTEQNTLLFKM